MPDSPRWRSNTPSHHLTGMPDSPWSPRSTHQLTCRHAGLAEGKDLQQCRTQKPTKLTCRRAGLAAGGKVAPSHRPLGMPDAQWNSTAATSGLAGTPDSPKFKAAPLKAALPAYRARRCDLGGGPRDGTTTRTAIGKRGRQASRPGPNELRRQVTSQLRRSRSAGAGDPRRLSAGRRLGCFLKGPRVARILLRDRTWAVFQQKPTSPRRSVGDSTRNRRGLQVDQPSPGPAYSGDRRTKGAVFFI